MDPTIKVLAFAGAREVLGTGELRLPWAAPAGARELLDRVCERYPRLAGYRGCLRVAINGTYAEAGDLVRAGDEVALIPPVAGG